MSVQPELVEMVSSKGYAPAVVRAALPPGVDQDRLSSAETYRLNRDAASRLKELFERAGINYHLISSTRTADRVLLTSEGLEALRREPHIVFDIALDYVTLSR